MKWRISNAYFASSAIHSPSAQPAAAVRPFVVCLCPINVENRCHFVHHPSSLHSPVPDEDTAPSFSGRCDARANITLGRPFPLDQAHITFTWGLVDASDTKSVDFPIMLRVVERHVTDVICTRPHRKRRKSHRQAATTAEDEQAPEVPIIRHFDLEKANKH